MTPSPTGADIACGSFTERFGHRPDGVWSAPGRVNLIGEHTDYNDGFALPFGVQLRTWVAVARRRDQQVRVATTHTNQIVERSLLRISRETVGGWAAYPLGTAWALGQLGADLPSLPGFDAFFHSDIPLGAGLSSSAAIECALAVALNELWELDLDRHSLLRAAHLAENDFVGAPTGVLDQSASLLAKEDRGLVLDFRAGDVGEVTLEFTAAGLSMLAIDTGVKHAHATGGYAERRRVCLHAARELGARALRDVAPEDLTGAAAHLDPLTMRRVRHVVSENERVLAAVDALGEGDFVTTGLLMTQSHGSLRYDFEVSVPELDLAVESALGAGALGARMTGGGFGGTAIALVEATAAPSVAAAVKAAFAHAQFAAPAVFKVTPSDGADRDL